MVSDDPTDGRCNASAGSGKEGFCESYPVTDDDGEPLNGRCRMHGAFSGAPEGNQNAVGNKSKPENTDTLQHGAYSARSARDLYPALDDDDQAYVDGLVATYAEAWGWPPDHPDRDRLIGACVDVWREQRTRDAIVADGPSEERVVGVNDYNEPIMATDEHHLSKQSSRLSTDVRQTLKDLREQGEDDAAALAEGVQSLAEALGGRADDG